MEKLQRSFLVIGGLIALLMLAVSPALAIPITNFSFENPALPNVGQGSATITGWTKTGTGTGGVYHASVNPPEGVQYGYTLNGLTLSQQLSATIVAGATYTLDAYTRRYRSNNDEFRVQLYAVTGPTTEVLLKELSGVSPYRVWTEEKFSWTADAYAGAFLKIKLVGSSGEIDFDNVTLDYTAVPVPAALLLFGTGLLGLVGLRGIRKIKA